MKLPVIRVVGKQCWDCHECGVCCRGTIIHLSNDDLAKIQAQHWEDDPDFANQTILRRDWQAESGRRLAQRADGSCVFLTASGRCRIHEKFGAGEKPHICRVFPLQVIPRENDAVLTLRRSCPSAAADEGRPLAEHLPEIKRLAAKGELAVELPTRTARERAYWHHANRLLPAVEKIFIDERYPPVRRVMHALLFARLLEKAKLAKLDERKFAELIEILEPSVISNANAYFTDRQPPSSLGRILFRLTAAQYVRLHPDYRPPKGFFARGKVLRASWRFMRGRGNVPALHPTFPPATFNGLDEPLGALHPAMLRPELLRPIERFLATSAASGQYALANRSRWTIPQSIRALAMTFPVALYLLRWATAGREPTPADVVNIVCALDRGQGYAALAGGRHRLVLRLLGWEEDLERLVVWYAR